MKGKSLQEEAKEQGYPKGCGYLPPIENYIDEFPTDEQMICSRCGKTQAQRNLEPPMATGIDHYVYGWTKSFLLYPNGTYLCPECHKETQLENLFKAMDNYAKKHGEDALAKKCGLKE